MWLPVPRSWKLNWNLSENLPRIERAIAETDSAQFGQEARLLYPRLTRFGFCMPSLDASKTNDSEDRVAHMRLHITFLKRLSREIRYRTFSTDKWNEDVARQNAGSISEEVPEASQSTEEQAFRRSPGAGIIAAKLILQQTNLWKAEMILHEFAVAPRRQCEAYPYTAFAGVLIEQGKLDWAGEVLLEMPDEVTSTERDDALAWLHAMREESNG